LSSIHGNPGNGDARTRYRDRRCASQVRADNGDPEGGSRKARVWSDRSQHRCGKGRVIALELDRTHVDSSIIEPMIEIGARIAEEVRRRRYRVGWSTGRNGINGR
jgi:hypothetical protein